MYKYEHYIKDFFLENKEVALEQIGVFKAGETARQSDENKNAGAPVIFQYNKKTLTSASLLDFIADKEKKNRQIISIGFESYLNEMRQLLNTGKEVAIEGLGFLFLNKNISYEFVQQSAATAKADNATRKIQNQDIEKFQRNASGRKKGQASVAFFSIILILLFAGAAGWGVYNLFFNKTEPDVVTSVNIPPEKNDSVVKQNTVSDTSAKRSVAAPANKSDSAFYKFIFETTTDETRAHSRIAKLREYGDPAESDSIQTDTGLVYRLFLVKKILISDTASTKDSVAKYFQRNIIVEPIHN